ncbi:MAG: PcfJ domain-containing protein, partial [Muribaculum sp.]|nr:PcfJ domain-containing protein [Muribaculum sp.]
TADEFWASYRIAKRHHYQINNIGMWCDYLRMLQSIGQDIHNPKNICPTDFIEAHDRVKHIIDARREKELAERQRRAEEERRDREQQRLLQEKQREEDFIALKSKFFGLVIADDEINVKVLESIEEYYEEGKSQNICVFGSGYYKKADTLILSARIAGEIIETVEVDLRTLKVVQCHGKNNQNTTYHDRIVNLVNSNSKLIKERMTA